MKRIKNYILAFIVPFILCMIIFYFKGILQDVENFFVSDLRIQHLAFFSYLKNIMLGKASLFYSFYAGMGSPMLATMIFYAISPINLLLLIIKDIQYAILFIYVLKVSLAGFTMYMYLHNRIHRDSFMMVVFSSCYALCSFVINYFFCVFWFDVLYLAPLVLMGIDKIFEYEKISLVYIMSLALAIICNIQMGFGLCVFSVIYFIYSFNIKYDFKSDFKKFVSLGFLFGIGSLCAGAISSGFLIAFMTEYSNISAARDIHVLEDAATTHIGYIFKNLFTVGNLKSDYFNNFEPFIYCGVIVSFYSMLYLFSSHIEKKKRYHAFLVIFVFLVCFSVRFLNLAWHLSTPMLLNYRYSVFLGLFLTMLACECYYSCSKLMKKDVTVLSIFLFIGLSMIVAFSGEVYVVYTFVFLILVYLFILLSKNKYHWCEGVLCLIVFAEICFNGYLSIYTPHELPYDRYASFDSLKELTSKDDFGNDYRVMYDYSYLECTSESLLLNKNSSSRYFSSIIQGNVLNFFNRNLSFVGNNNYKVSAFDSPLLLSLLGNKYFYLIDEFNNSIYEKKKSYVISNYDYVKKKVLDKDVYLYENPYALSLGYVVDSDVSYQDDMDLVDYQNAIIKSFTGVDEDVLVRFQYDVDNNYDYCGNDESCRTFHLVNDTDNILVYVYGLWRMYNVDEGVNVYYDTNKPLLFSSVNRNVNFALSLDGIENETYVISTYRKDALIHQLGILQENMLHDIKVDNNKMKAHLSSSKDGILFLSIPYDKNFKIYVDGKKVKYYSLLDHAFMGIDVVSGEHDIEIKYVDDNLKWYVICSVCSFIVTLVVCFFVNRHITKRKMEEEKILLEMEKKRELKQKAMEEKARKAKESKVHQNKSYKKKKK